MGPAADRARGLLDHLRPGALFRRGLCVVSRVSKRAARSGPAAEEDVAGAAPDKTTPPVQLVKFGGVRKLNPRKDFGMWKLSGDCQIHALVV
jgi:hypothetical protein